MHAWEIGNEEDVGVVGPSVNLLLNFFQLVSKIIECNKLIFCINIIEN